MPANPLAAIHLELGASLAERAGTPVPVRYGDSVAEHRAVRATVGVFDLTSAGKLWITGAERIRFLQGVLAADVDATLIDRDDALLISRHAIVASHALVWLVAITPTEKTTAIAQREARGVLVRTAA